MSCQQETSSNSKRPSVQKLDFTLLKQAKGKAVYSSRSESNPSSSIQTSEPKPKTSKASSKYRIKSLNKTMNSLAVDPGLLNSIRLIKQRKHNPELDLIKEYCQIVLTANTRENRYNLVDVLQQLHPFFSKVHTNIAQAIILLGKIGTYHKGQLIFSCPQVQQSHSQLPNKKVNRSSQDLGLLLYGKLHLQNPKHFYSHYLTNSGTLFQHRFINRPQKLDYYAEVIQPACIVWLSKESYYVIRRECFLSLDLKYYFGEFENLLGYFMVRKKQGTAGL